MKKFALTICCLLLAGCASMDDISTGLYHLDNASPKEVFQVLGYPDGGMPIDSETVVYYWGNNYTESYELPSYQTSYGTIGGSNFSMNTLGSETHYVNFRCKIKCVFTNGRLVDWVYSGNEGGCYPYTIRMNDYLKEEQNKSYIKCLKEQSKTLSKDIKDSDILSSKIEDICKKEEGYNPGNRLPKFYSDMALGRKR